MEPSMEDEILKSPQPEKNVQRGTDLTPNVIDQLNIILSHTGEENKLKRDISETAEDEKIERHIWPDK